MLGIMCLLTSAFPAPKIQILYPRGVSLGFPLCILRERDSGWQIDWSSPCPLVLLQTRLYSQFHSPNKFQSHRCQCAICGMPLMLPPGPTWYLLSDTVLICYKIWEFGSTLLRQWQMTGEDAQQIAWENRASWGSFHLVTMKPCTYQEVFPMCVVCCNRHWQA